MDDCACSHSNTEAGCTPLVQERVAIGGHGVQPLLAMTGTDSGATVRVSAYSL